MNTIVLRAIFMGAGILLYGCGGREEKAPEQPSRVGAAEEDLSAQKSVAAARRRDAAPKIISFGGGETPGEGREHAVSVFRDGRWVREKTLEGGGTEGQEITRGTGSGLQGAGLQVQGLPGEP